MLEALLPLAPAAPALGASLLGAGMVSERMDGEASERLTGRIALVSTSLAFLTALLAYGLHLSGNLGGPADFGTWLSSGSYRVAVNFNADGLSLGLAALFALLCLLTARFSINYLHREPGYHRFFLILQLFASAVLLLVLAGNAVLAFVGWELAGVCSYLLIAYAYDRPVAARNATRAFVTNRVGDAGFVTGIFLAFGATGSVDWSVIQASADALDPPLAGGIALAFLLAAIAKSAQVPLSPWLLRAMEGPTPSSAMFYGAVMIHAGVYLVLRLQPVFEQSPWTLAALAVIGLTTAVYGYVCGLVQADVKSALAFSGLAQIGLMFLESGLGFWHLAAWHLGAHAIFRGYQFLTAPSLMHQVLGTPARAPAAFIARHARLHHAALRRCWLEEAGDSVATRPVQAFAADLERFDQTVIDPLLGVPTPLMDGMASLARWEEHKATPGGVPRAPAAGMVARLVRWAAAGLNWFEEHLVLEGLGSRLLVAGRWLGWQLGRVESVLSRPRYLVLLVAVLLLAHWKG